MTEELFIALPITESCMPKVSKVLPRVYNLLVDNQLGADETFFIVDGLVAYIAGRSGCSAQEVGKFIYERSEHIDATLSKGEAAKILESAVLVDLRDKSEPSTLN
jgi:hypothetical protein